MCKIDSVPVGVQDGPVSPEDLEHFVRRGYLIVPPRVPAEVHETIRSKAAAIARLGPNATVQLGDDCLPAIPEVMTVLDAPAVRKATEAVLGEDYMLHGHRHLHVSSAKEQMWHKDSYWGFRRIRHHRPRWCMMLYYPQETTLEMGPTHVLAGSQYWTIDTEKSPQGEDILADASGHVSMFVEGNCLERQERLKEAEQRLLGPGPHRTAALAEDVSLTVPAGSCVLMHYDLFHRAGFRAKEDAPVRFMFKFQFIRTREPAAVFHGLPLPVEGSPRSASPGSLRGSASPLGCKAAIEVETSGVSKGADFCKRRRQLRRQCPWGDEDAIEVFVEEEAGDAMLAQELLAVTSDVRSWLLGVAHPCETASASATPQEAHQDVELGLEVLRKAGATCLDEGEAEEMERTEHDEVKLVSAAYHLARSPDRTWLALLCGLTGGSEAVARAATYGLSAAGPRAAPALIPLLKHAAKRVRLAAAFALGESARPTCEVISAFEEAVLATQPWSLEAAHLLQALSCLSARASAYGELGHCQRCVEIALPYLVPTAGHNLLCENACLVVLLSGKLGGDVGKMALAAIQSIADRSGDPYNVGFANEILRRHEQDSGSPPPEMEEIEIARVPEAQEVPPSCLSS